MDYFKVKIEFTDGSNIERGLWAENFGDACKLIYEDQEREAPFIKSFTNLKA